MGMLDRGVSAFFSFSLIKICYFLLYWCIAPDLFSILFSSVIIHGIKNWDISCISIMIALQKCMYLKMPCSAF